MPFKDPKKRKEYDREHKREIRKKFPEKTREIQKKSYEKNRKKILEHQKQQRLKDPGKYRTRQKRWRHDNPEKVRQIYDRRKVSGLENRVILKREVFSHYSKSLKCICCGVKGIEFLTVDHIIPKREMAKDKKLFQKKFTSKLIGEALNKWLKKNNYPKGFQILCWNCNFAKGVLGICPHKE